MNRIRQQSSDPPVIGMIAALRFWLVETANQFYVVQLARFKD
jgi:hypothetical protein